MIEDYGVVSRQPKAERLLGSFAGGSSPGRLAGNQGNQRAKRFVNRLGVWEKLSNIRFQHDRAFLNGEVLRGDRAVCFVNSDSMTAAVVLIILTPDASLS